jgi:YfiH family protein
MMSVNLTELFIQPEWPAPAKIKAYTSLRQSEVSDANGIKKPELKQILNLPQEPVWIKQVHGTNAVKAIPENQATEADAIFTDKPETVCLVQTADCMPVFITNRLGTVVAAVHAGWRGLSQGIIEGTIAKLNMPADDILVWLGPSIGPEKFEVRQDVYDAFTSNHPEAVQAFHKINADQWLADLIMLARQRLASIGIKNIYGGAYCTHTDQERFFSYRRDGKLLGRIVNAIWISQ